MQYKTDIISKCVYGAYVFVASAADATHKSHLTSKTISNIYRERSKRKPIYFYVLSRNLDHEIWRLRDFESFIGIFPNSGRQTFT
jgi:hypothetical protein